MYCRKCGRELSEDTEFCPKCGIKVESNKTVNETTVEETRNINKGTNKKTRNIIIGLLGIVVLLFVVLIGKILNNDSNELDGDKVTLEEQINDAIYDSTYTEIEAALEGYSYLLENTYGEMEAKYYMMYLNDDDIPELIVESESIDDGYALLSYRNDNLGGVTLPAGNFSYIEKENLIHIHEGFYGQSGYNYVYSLTDDIDITTKFLGGYSGKESTLTGEYQLVYEENKEEIEESEYWSRLADVFDTSRMTELGEGYTTIQDAYEALQ